VAEDRAAVVMVIWRQWRMSGMVFTYQSSSMTACLPTSERDYSSSGSCLGRTREAFSEMTWGRFLVYFCNCF